MKGLVDNPGKFRNKGVGIVKGNDVEHIAPPADKVPFLMKDLLSYLKDADELTLIKSCVFHYEMEFIHPFLDGNGRMGRFWQTLILCDEYPIFEFLPFETLINETQNEYYQALSTSDKMGKSTVFIEYMLEVINNSLESILSYNNRILKDIDRIEYFVSFGMQVFTRKDYMNTFKDLSSATASRDLKKGVELQFFEVLGSKNQTKYRVL
jgi:Fic family protein